MIVFSVLRNSGIADVNYIILGIIEIIFSSPLGDRLVLNMKSHKYSLK